MSKDGIDLTVGARTFTYDANGNATADGLRQVAWDAANRLGEVRDSAGTVMASFEYGPDNARVSKASAFARTLYPDAGVEIDATTALFDQTVASLTVTPAVPATRP